MDKIKTVAEILKALDEDIKNYFFAKYGEEADKKLKEFAENHLKK